jgi:hypothetical protein
VSRNVEKSATSASLQAPRNLVSSS